MVLLLPPLYAVTAQTSLAPLSWFHGSRVTTAHAHQCCIFQSYAKTVPSRIKLTIREPASMTTDTWSRRVTSDFNSVYSNKSPQITFITDYKLTWRRAVINSDHDVIHRYVAEIWSTLNNFKNNLKGQRWNVEKQDESTCTCTCINAQLCKKSHCKWVEFCNVCKHQS